MGIEYSLIPPVMTTASKCRILVVKNGMQPLLLLANSIVKSAKMDSVPVKTEIE
jgi:hypothetical protein